MKELLKKSLDFIKENPRIIYSLVLVFVIPLAIFLNTYFTVKDFEANLEEIIRSKAVLAEDIVKFVARDAVQEPQKLQRLISETKALNTDIGVFEILIPDEQTAGFKVIASSEKESENKILSDPKDIFYHQIAWNQPSDNVSFVTEENSNRSWNVLETIKNGAGDKIALAFLSFPLTEFDTMNSQAETRSYLILIITVLIVLLLVANNARLFGYALTLSKLKEIDQMKDTFISMASHELRAPLTAMKGNIEFFNEESAQAIDEKGRHYIDNISNSVERLEMLVNDILEVSRLEGNRIPISISAVDPGPIVEKSIEEIRAQAAQKNLEIDYSPEKLPQVKADPERLKQIVVNLLSNAIKYTIKGRIEVLAKVEGKNLLLTVADTGVGISAVDQSKLFHKFSRVYNEETKSVSGTGLGLWISRELAVKMGGDMTVESIRGVGSHFTLHLPLA